MTNDNRSEIKSKPKYVSFGNKEFDKEIRKRFNKLMKLNEDYTNADSAPLTQLAVQEWNLELLTLELARLATISTERAKIARQHSDCQKNINALRKSLCLAYDERTKQVVSTIEVAAENPLKSLL